MSVWKSKKLTLAEKLLRLIGLEKAERTIHMHCAWCQAPFKWIGAGPPPAFCRPAHKKATRAAYVAANKPKPASTPPPITQTIRTVTPTPPEAITALAPKPECRCRNHLGRQKARYASNASATRALIKRHLKYGGHRIYECPTTNYWHITSQLVRKEAA